MMLAYNPIAIQIGSFQVAWYALCILTGVIIAVIMAVREARKLGIDPNIIYDGVLYILPLSIIGARLYFVLFDSFTNGSYYNWNILKMIGFTFSQGKITGFQLEGLAIHGGIIVAFISVLVYCKIKKVNIWHILDLVAPGFLIGQICGRWGNFMNQELYGASVDNLNWLPSFISEQMYINGSYRQPLFLYEILWNLTALIVILILRRKKVLRIGDIAGIYLVWYGIGRAFLEPLRDPIFIMTNGSNQMQSVITSILLIIVGIIFIVVKYIKFRNLPYYVDTFVSKEEYFENKDILKIKEWINSKKKNKTLDNEGDSNGKDDSI